MTLTLKKNLYYYSLALDAFSQVKLILFRENHTHSDPEFSHLHITNMMIERRKRFFNMFPMAINI